jgi:hypothetical protein
MAGTSSSQVKNFRDNLTGERSSDRETGVSRRSNEQESRKSPSQLIQQAVRLERWSKYWSILSNIAALVSISSAVYTITKKNRRFW